MSAFRYLWDSITASMQDKLCEETLAGVLLKEPEQPAKLRGDINYYYRQPDGHAGHSYPFLKRCMGRFIEREQQKKNRDDMAQVLQRGGRTAHSRDAAPADPHANPVSAVRGAGGGDGGGRGSRPVSYTHLTLPTIYSV